MFTLNFDQAVVDAGSILQFEYSISEANIPLPVLSHGFIALENAVTTTGIVNQCVIAVPAASNIYEPAPDTEVQIRIYVGSTTTNAIMVSEWSNLCPVHNPPEQPSDTVRAYIVTGDNSGGYVYPDTLYVQIPQNSSYDLGEVQFVVTYNYKDDTGNYQWIVSSPLDGTLNGDIISIYPITLDIDLGYGDTMYVAVNTIYSYVFDTTTYYTVSEISTTVEATTAIPDAPILDPIVIPDDYFVYNDFMPSQTVHLHWTNPSVGLIPELGFSGLVARLYVGDVLIESHDITNTSTVDYDFTIPDAYVNLLINNTTALDFRIGAIYTGEPILSNVASVNTFRYSTEPTNAIVNWANSGYYPETQMDISVSFNNPTNAGIYRHVGMGVVAPYFLIKVYDNSTIPVLKGTSEPIPYVSMQSGAYTYVFDDVATTTAGHVSVYLVTQDTNQTTSGVDTGSYVARNGASADANYVGTELPIVTITVHDDVQLNFTVVSNVALGQYQSIMALSTVSPFPITPVQWESTHTSTSPYSVSLTMVADDYVYTCSFPASWFSDNELDLTGAYGLVVAASNNVGIGTAMSTYVD